MSPKRVIGVDLGGTKILAGSIDGEGRVLARHEVPTPTSSQAELLEGIAAAVEPLVDETTAALGIGIPSIIDHTSGQALVSNNIPLQDIAVGRLMSERFRVPAAVENDGNLAALAEWRLGAGRGANNMVMLTLGTGVGGGLVLDGALYRGWAELGHMVVVADGPPCQGNCTGRGHLESLASGSAGDRAAEKLWGEGATAELLVGRASEGDEAALEALAGIGHLLGAAIGSLLNIFGTELVVIGGGFGTAAAEFLFPQALEIARREALLDSSRVGLRIVTAELGSDAGLIGAGLLALEEH
ncbi:MAG TPA: ROK family protein [Gaiellaceae bacterium]|nr:ROK family protein [Gaiellaceae bacterium]